MEYNIKLEYIKKNDIKLYELHNILASHLNITIILHYTITIRYN